MVELMFHWMKERIKNELMNVWIVLSWINEYSIKNIGGDNHDNDNHDD